MSDVDEFMREQPASQPRAGRKSKLEPYKSDILKLHGGDYLLPQIQQFLLQRRGVEVSISQLSRFIAKNDEVVKKP
ncbi:hypothetical protein ACPRNU_13990 [Chromobacterium vaccinii]|uniref:hypothetical protein n=1 Tax=Chromobacterium vaccinii TaxID=1108595 RepID=UPI003C71C3E5